MSKLRRLPRDEDGFSRYLHPEGYVIVAARRDWSLRGYTRGAAHQWAPLTWWEVYEHVANRGDDVDVRYRPQARRTRLAVNESFLTLREARAWCDANPREGWGQR